MLKILAFGNADKKLSINFLGYLIGCEVLNANAVLRKVNAKIVNAGKLMPTFDLKKGVSDEGFINLAVRCSVVHIRHTQS